jgi:hypothetical protein
MLAFGEAGAAAAHIQFADAVLGHGGCGGVHENHLFVIFGDGANGNPLIEPAGFDDAFAPFSVTATLVVGQDARWTVGQRGQHIVAEHFVSR